MSIFTPVSEPELIRHLENYDLGRLIDWRGISAGIENTNYFVTTTHAEMVLTLFELTPVADLPFFLELMAYLADSGLPCARPYADRDGRYLRTLKSRSAVFVQKLPGRPAERPGAPQLTAIGRALAQLHRLTAASALQRANDRGPVWWSVMTAKLDTHLQPAEALLMRQELAEQRAFDETGLPSSVIHADLFRDNALFEDDRLTGIIDLYYACTGPHIYDLAITINDWCIGADCRFDPQAAHCLIDAYRAEHPISTAQRSAWPMMLRRAALRFWLSRLHDFHYPRTGVLIQQKSPDRFQRILEHHRNNPAILVSVWD